MNGDRWKWTDKSDMRTVCEQLVTRISAASAGSPFRDLKEPRTNQSCLLHLRNTPKRSIDRIDQQMELPGLHLSLLIALLFVKKKNKCWSLVKRYLIRLGTCISYFFGQACNGSRSETLRTRSEDWSNLRLCLLNKGISVFTFFSILAALQREIKIIKSL